MSHPDSAILRDAGRLLDSGIVAAERLGGGSLSEIWRAVLDDGRSVVIKNGPAPRVEAAMLEAIAAAGVPTPRVEAVDDRVLIIESLSAGGSLRLAWRSLGRALAALHSAQGGRYGWRDDYAFGSVALANRACDDWPAFWAEQRLIGPGRRLSAVYARRLELLARDLPDRLPRRPPPALLHGDLWGGNVLVAGGRVSGLVDPACYYGHAEVDLAMLMLFDAPTTDFFMAYGKVEPEFEQRLPVYQLWPAIVHVRLFGSSYHGMLERLLDRAGV